MKIAKKHIIASLALGLMVFALSCGGASDIGSEGSWGVWDTNTYVYLDLSSQSLAVDVCDPSPSAIVANITTMIVSDTVPAYQMYMDGYNIDFEPFDINSPPIADADMSLFKYIPDADVPMLYIDTDRKYAFLRAMNSGGYPASPAYPQYDADYTIYGSHVKDPTPALWGTTSSFSFTMGKYSPCVPVIAPIVANVVTAGNPDITEGDDITFQIKGGTAPFNTSSDSPLITVPGVLNVGQFDFTVDPDTGSLPATVIITITDALGETANATVYLK